jgi:hypothetical protein
MHARINLGFGGETLAQLPFPYSFAVVFALPGKPGFLQK